jgi:hypothetical protein
VDASEFPGGSSDGPSSFPPETPHPSEPTAQALATSSTVAVAHPSGPPSPPYSASLEITYPSELNRWLPLVKWLLAIPHYVVLFFVGVGAFFVMIYGFFAVLFTGRWPRGAFEYLVGAARWYFRVLAYVHLMTDAYPPFSLADDPGYPLRLNIDHPDRIANWRALVQWLLAIPYLWIAAVLYWLTGVLTIVSFFTVLFTKKIPRGVFELMVPGLRWTVRGDAYAYFMTDRYPPFIWG